MGKLTHHNPPNLFQYRAQQVLGLVGAVLLIVAMPLLVFIAVALEGPLLFLGVPLLGLLLLPLLHMLNASPPVSADDAGLTVRPFLLRERFIPWESVAEVRDYPLLPTENHETLRKFVVDGRKKYQAPRGQMLIIPALPWPYRLTGLFAGAGGRPVIALTSRTHTDYDTLMARVSRSLRRAQHIS